MGFSKQLLQQLDILLSLPCLDTVGKKVAKNSALMAVSPHNMWKSNNFGHSTILPVNHINTDSVVSSLSFGQKFRD